MVHNKIIFSAILKILLHCCVYFGLTSILNNLSACTKYFFIEIFNSFGFGIAICYSLNSSRPLGLCPPCTIFCRITWTCLLVTTYKPIIYVCVCVYGLWLWRRWCACVCMHVSCMFDDFDESKKRKMDRKKWIRRKTKKKKHYGGELGKRKIKFSLT